MTQFRLQSACQLSGAAMPQSRRSLSVFALRKSGFAPRTVYMGFVVDSVAMWQVSLRVQRFGNACYHSTIN
jgi:hypothetical protein